MAIIPMTVCDSEGITDEKGTPGYLARGTPKTYKETDKEGKTTIKIVSINDPYQFYAIEPENATPKIVLLVMPIGGDLSGLYRYPKIGETVLVAQEISGNYLLGYIPSDGEPFYADPPAPAQKTGETDDDFNRRKSAMEAEAINQTIDCGEVFRYKKTGTNTSDDEYSEIGFYRKEADWPLYETDADGNPAPVYKRKADGTKIDPPEIEYPDIDNLNVQSTGDIRSRAENHHLIMAKRFELLADCLEINHRTNRNAENELPLGDNPGDDSVLHAGDVHIRAGKRVLIKAEEEICLQVGRSVLSLSDEGITIKSKVTNSNFENVLDATLGLSPREGINIFGQNVNISAGKGFQLGDTYGGSISSTVGVVGVNGREVKLQAYDAMEYLFTSIFAAFKLIQSTTSGSMALSGSEDTQVAQYVNFTFDILQRVIELVKNVYEGYQAQKNTEEKETLEDAAKRTEAEAQAAEADAAKAAKNEADAEAALKDSAEKIDALKKEKEAADKDAAAKLKVVEDAGAEAAKKQKVVDAAAADADAKQKAAADAATDADARKKAAADAAADAAAKKKAAEEPNAEAAKKQKVADDAQSEANANAAALKKAEDEVAARDAERKAAQKETHKLEKEVAVAEADANKKQQTADSANTSRDEKKQTAAVKTEEMDALVSQKNALQAEINKAKGKEKKALQKQMDDLNQNIATKQSELRSAQQQANMYMASAAVEDSKATQAADTAAKKKEDAKEARDDYETKKKETKDAKDAATTKKTEADTAQMAATTKKTEADTAQTAANASNDAADAAQNNATAKRREADDAQTDATRKKAEADNAETNKKLAQKDADDADAKKTAAQKDAADAKKKQDELDASSKAQDDDMKKKNKELMDAREDTVNKQQTAEEKRKIADEAQQQLDKLNKENASSGLTDEFDQEIDITTVDKEYVPPDYQPDTTFDPPSSELKKRQ